MSKTIYEIEKRTNLRDGLYEWWVYQLWATSHGKRSYLNTFRSEQGAREFIERRESPPVVVARLEVENINGKITTVQIA